MKNKRTVLNREEQLTTCASCAVGFSKLQAPSDGAWYIAIVLNNTEIASRNRLIQLGYDAYVPAQQEMHKWKDGRTKMRENVLLKNLVFVHTTEGKRKMLIEFPFIRKFLTDTARKRTPFTQSPVAIIPNSQIEDLKFMLSHCNEEITIEPLSVHIGDRVKIVRGKLAGLQGYIFKEAGKSKVGILIDGIGYACTYLPITDLHIINQ
ncbi:MAG: UpxY family transcription antiterminator [Prevotellaceae bacterium]|nr:UpxY family transcription antiterminator [Prevotellaceae bacterium]